MVRGDAQWRDTIGMYTDLCAAQAGTLHGGLAHEFAALALVLQ